MRTKKKKRTEGKKMTFSFHLPKLETRSVDPNGKPNYIVKGYATTAGNVYPYKTTGNKAFREFFTSKAIDNMRKKIKSKKVFVDAEHILGTKHSSEKILDDIKSKTGVDVSQEIDYIKGRLKFSEIPMFKVEDIMIDDKGLFVEIRGNPFYREVDADHQKYFDSVWGSLERGFINGLSLNFKPISTVKVNDTLTQIDDVDIYGISLTGSPANEMANITEVAMRSIEHLRGEKKCLKKRTTTSSLLM